MGVTAFRTMACALIVTATVMLGVTAAIATTTTSISPEVRVNQVGYVPDATKVAFAMLPRPVAGVAIASSASLYTRLVNNGVRYFTSERDGADVDPAVMNRQPANLTDEHAYVYADPDYDSNDNLLGTFRMGPEAQFGLEWLAKLWNPARKVMYIQAGIGNRSAPTKQYPEGQIQGDYNFWFLPQREDRLDVSEGGNPGPTAYYVKYRPVFEAAPPGQPVSPELAGRFAAGFALAAQVRGTAPQARELLTLARGVYADAKTANAGQITTTFPYDYYPGTEWKSRITVTHSICTTTVRSRKPNCSGRCVPHTRT